MLISWVRTIALMIALSSLCVSAPPALSQESDDQAETEAAVSSDATSEEESEKADTDAKPRETTARKLPTMDEMRGHRQVLRKSLMVPSLEGIRGISYGVPGTHPFPDVEQVIETRLKQLPIPIAKISELQSGETKPVDGILQVKILGGGGDMNVVELTLTQWSQLVRNPDVKVKAVTYKDQAVTHRKVVRDTVGKMVNQFVLDYLQANHLKANEGKKKKG
ncbi:MAG: hypothetical protein K8F91_11325 [Candidatus Obscuribacterales bacterium]|nr:hypothetical protein [Candidatus Obscuribacterales bacterium]